MRKLLLYDASPAAGGALTSASSLVEELVARGWSAHVVFAQEQVCQAFEGWRRAALPGAPVVARALGIGAMQGWSGGAWLWREARRAAWLAAEIARERPTAALMNNGPQANAAGLWAARALGVPTAQYVRGPLHSSALAGRLLGLSRARFVVGEDARRGVEGLGWSARVVGEGLSRSQQPSVRRAGAARWLWASALVEWKGLGLMAEAYGALEGARPGLDIAYIPVESPERAALPALPTGARALCMPAGLDALRAQSVAYIHTALKPEPFGRSILEAQAAGLCAVVPDEGGAAAQVAHEETGLVYQARSAASLTAALERLRRSPALAHALGERARREVEASGRASVVFGEVMGVLEGL